MKQKSLNEHVLGTYLTLRRGIAILAIAFPILLYVIGKAWAGLPLQDSISAYYHQVSASGESMRDWFVGVLFAVGVFLYLYKGYSKLENYTLNVAGVLALGVAIFPMSWDCAEALAPAMCRKFAGIELSGGTSVHGFCAVLFFLCIAFVAVKCAPDTLRLIADERLRERYRKLYRGLAVCMVLSPFAACIYNLFWGKPSALMFFVEAFAIVAFAAYWLTKSKELAITGAETKALRGELAMHARAATEQSASVALQG